jgi:hypothetical protein
MKIINERLKKLEDLLLELKEESYSRQYGIADFVETDAKLKAEIDQLAKETLMYNKVYNMCQGLKKDW